MTTLTFRSLEGEIGTRMCPSVHPQSFCDLDIIWCMGRPQPYMRTSITSARCKVKIKVTELLKFQKLHFSTSVSSAILTWSLKLMDSMGPSRQLFGARFLNLFPSWRLRDFEVREMLTSTESNGFYLCDA